MLHEGAYSAWGAPLTGSAAPTPFAWNGRTGAYTDGETGLIQMGARYYAPAIGAFLSRDPAGFAGGVNLYAYCIGDPVNFYDPTGEMPVAAPLILGGGTIGAGVRAYQAYRNGQPIGPAAWHGFKEGSVAGLAAPMLGCSLPGVVIAGGLGGFASEAVNQHATHGTNFQKRRSERAIYSHFKIVWLPMER